MGNSGPKKRTAFLPILTPKKEHTTNQPPDPDLGRLNAQIEAIKAASGSTPAETAKFRVLAFLATAALAQTDTLRFWNWLYRIEAGERIEPPAIGSTGLQSASHLWLETLAAEDVRLATTKAEVNLVERDAEKNADDLQKLVAILSEAKQEINLARGQSTKPRHLQIRARRAVVQAARAVTAAVDLGFHSIWPMGEWLVSMQRKPIDPDRKPGTIQMGDWKASIVCLSVGSGCNPDGTLMDDTALCLWTQFICPSLRSRHNALKADAGGFDFPKVKTDDKGQILGQDGKPLPVIEKKDPNTGELLERRIEGIEARVTDDYDETDFLEHLRCQAADWADACAIAVDLIQEEIRKAASTQPTEFANEALMEGAQMSSSRTISFTLIPNAEKRCPRFLDAVLNEYWQSLWIARLTVFKRLFDWVQPAILDLVGLPADTPIATGDSEADRAFIRANDAYILGYSCEDPRVKAIHDRQNAEWFELTNLPPLTTPEEWWAAATRAQASPPIEFGKGDFERYTNIIVAWARDRQLREESPGLGQIPPVNKPLRYSELLAFCECELKGLQLKLVKFLCQNEGKAALADVLAEMDWENEKAFEATQGRVNKKLKKARWRVERNDNAVVLASFANPTQT